MKWVALFSTLLLTACSFNDPDDIAYRQVIVPSSPNKINLWGDSPSMDATTTTVSYL